MITDRVLSKVFADRAAQGLERTVTDPQALTRIAAIVAASSCRTEGGHHHVEPHRPRTHG